MENLPILVQIVKNRKGTKISVFNEGEKVPKTVFPVISEHRFRLNVPNNFQTFLGRRQLILNVLGNFEKRNLTNKFIKEILDKIYTKLGQGKFSEKTLSNDIKILQPSIKRRGKKGPIRLAKPSLEDAINYLADFADTKNRNMGYMKSILQRDYLPYLTVYTPVKYQGKVMIEHIVHDMDILDKPFLEMLKRWIQSVYLQNALTLGKEIELNDVLSGDSTIVLQIHNNKMMDKNLIELARRELNELEIGYTKLSKIISVLKETIKYIDELGGQLSIKEVDEHLNKLYIKESQIIKTFLKNYCDPMQLNKGIVSLQQSGEIILRNIEKYFP